MKIVLETFQVQVCFILDVDLSGSQIFPCKATIFCEPKINCEEMRVRYKTSYGTGPEREERKSKSKNKKK